MPSVKMFTGEGIPLEMHKVRIVQKLRLIPIEDRLKAIAEAGNNTFLLQNCDVFLDMLTDSGVNAMSDNQLASMITADDAYAGSATFTRLANKLTEIFGTRYFLPAHQGRAAEHILAKTYVTPGSVVPTNFHFTTTKALITLYGGSVDEVLIDEGLKTKSTYPFKGNSDIAKLRAVIQKNGPEKIPFVRLESGTNLVGGQPFSLANMKDVPARFATSTDLCSYWMRASYRIICTSSRPARRVASRKRFARSRARSPICATSSTFRRANWVQPVGGIITNSEKAYRNLRNLVPLFEGFLTYGGMSVREMEAMGSRLGRDHGRRGHQPRAAVH